MVLQLHRQMNTGIAQVGTLTAGNFTCDTIENADRIIPQGFYHVRLTMSPKFGIVLPLLDHVTGRTGIRIHPGNTAEDSEGCILVGELDATVPRLLSSKRTFVQLMAVLLAANQEREEIWINIVDPDPTAAGYDAATRQGFQDNDDGRVVVYVFQDMTEPVRSNNQQH